jgi:hypothetical protein
MDKQKHFEVNEITSLNENQIKIIVTGLNDYSNSEIRDIMYEAFIIKNKPEPESR